MSENMRGEGPLFPHPFSKAYWLQAASEFKKQRVLIFAALMIALRVVLKSMGIPIAADLKINVAFFINAYGAMVFGPVVAIVAAAVPRKTILPVYAEISMFAALSSVRIKRPV